jgi:3-oxoacyl-[acyl-carrier-protein] synthase III
LALVIGADCHSRVVNPADKQTFPLFGDGAGAVLIGPGNRDQGLVAYAVGSDGSGADLLYRPMGGSRLPFPDGKDDQRRFMYMDGRPVFKWAVRMLNDTVRDVLRFAEVSLDDVDLVVFHQANARIISAAVEDLEIDPAKVFNNLDRYGNTAAASIPLAMDEAHQQGRIRPGDLILTSGFGGGLAWGTALVRW